MSTKHTLLHRQINKFLTSELVDHPAVKAFIDAVNESYTSFERDKEIMNHAFTVSEKEYIEVNENLSNEARLKELSIEKLKEGIKNITGTEFSAIDHHKQGLLPIVDFLNSEISKRKVVEEDLSRTLIMLKTLLVNLHSGILVEDENRKILFTNQQFCTIFSIPINPEKMLGADCSESAQQSKGLFKDPEGFVTLIEKLLKEKKKVVNIELEMQNGNTLLLDYVPIYIGDIYKGHLWDYSDITERKRAELNLKSITNVQHTILNGTNYSIIYTDPRGIIRSFNKGAEDMLEYKAEEVIGKHNPGLFHLQSEITERAAGLSKQLQRTIEPGFEVFVARPRNGVVETREWTYLTKSGKELTVLLSVSSIRNPNGEIIGFLGIARDISEQKHAEKALKLTEARYKNIIDNSSEIIYKTDRLGNFTFVNAVAQRITAYSEQELLKMNYLDLIKGTHIKRTRKFYLHQVLNKIPSTYLEFPIISKDNREIWIGQSVQLSVTDTNDIELVALAIDVSKQKQAEKTLKKQEEKYRNIIANMNLGLLEVDVEERIQFANQSFMDMSGYTREELLGKRAIELFVKGNNEDILRKKNNSRLKGLSDSYEIRLKNKRGEMKWWMISGAPNYNDEGVLIGSVGIHLDITEQKKLEHELEGAKRRAEEASRAKESFLANMSHEIRTPLNAITGMIRELNKEDLNPQQKNYVENSYKASKLLLSIINNILDISKIEAGELSLELEHFRLSDSFSNVLSILNARAEEKGLYIKYFISGNISEVFVGDALRIEQILVNLLSNAIKFTNSGGITINCNLIKDEEKKQKIELSVSDTGIGMDQKYLTSIFSKFSQEDKSTSRRFGGTGLGMAITYELVHLMNGEIEVKSQKNFGTTFTVTLVLNKGSHEKLKRSLPAGSVNNLEGLNILLVEDNEMNRLVAQNVLKHYGCHVTEAVNGLEALEILQQKTFDVILMDIQMPEMDGIEATKTIRGELKLNTPIIALTANAFKSELELCKSIGMNDYVTKPFEESVLINTIAKYKEMQLTSSGTTLNLNAKTKMPLFNLKTLTQTSRGDETFVNKMIELFIKQSEETIQQFSAALAEERYTDLSKLAHKIKPSIDNMGIVSLKEKIRQLEKESAGNCNVESVSDLVTEINSVLKEINHQLVSDYIRNA